MLFKSGDFTPKGNSRSIPCIGRQIFASIAANIGAFTFGSSWAWTATALPSMAEDSDSDSFEITLVQASWLAAILFLGCLVSSVVSSWFIENQGRRKTMLLANVPCIASWILIGFAPNVETIYMARFVSGVCIACYGSATPLYISEISHSKIRGRLVCSFDSFVAAGMVFINIFGSYYPWRIQAFICGVIPILGHICLLLIPESPRFLIQNERHDEAKAALAWLNPGSTEFDLEQELTEIALGCNNNKDVEKDSVTPSGFFQVIFDKSIMRPILIVSTLMVFHQLSGNYPIVAYGVEIFSAIGSGNPTFGITMINSAQLVASIVPIFLVDTLGRRSLLIVSQLAMGGCLTSLAIYAFLPNSASDWLPLCALLIYEVFFALGIGPIPFLLMGELISPKKTALSLGITTGIHRALGFVEIFVFHDLMTSLGQGGTYALFAVFCVMGACMSWAIVPNTTGKTLEEIHAEGFTTTTEKNQKCKSQVELELGRRISIFVQKF